MREKVVKEWNIPKIITDDIGYQLMFGNQTSPAKTPSSSGITTRNIDYKGYARD